MPPAMSLIRFTQSANIKAIPVHLTSLYDKVSSFLASHAEQLHGIYFFGRQLLGSLVQLHALAYRQAPALTTSSLFDNKVIHPST